MSQLTSQEPDMMSKVPFCYCQPILENDFVRLEPFDPKTHVSDFVAGVKAHQEVTDYIPFPIVNTPADFLTTMWAAKFASSAQACLYSVFNKKRKEVPDSSNSNSNSNGNSNFAGVISLFDTDLEAAATEIGVMIFPSHQGTHVARNAVGLVLLWLMDPPSAGGLGLRRLEWQSHPQNVKSRRFAERMGLEFEGVLRWKKAFPGGKISLSAEKLRVRNGTEEEVPGSHTAIYSVVWEEWEEKRLVVVEQMRRG